MSVPQKSHLKMFFVKYSLLCIALMALLGASTKLTASSVSYHPGYIVAKFAMILLKSGGV